MLDPGNQQSVQVLLDSAREPYIRLTVQALERVRQILVDNGVSFQVDPYIISINKNPAVAWIWIHQKTDPVQLQSVLDSVP